MAERLEQSIDRLTEHLDGALEQFNERLDKALARSETMHPEQSAQELVKHLDYMMIARHPAGMCDKDGCQMCLQQREAIALGVLNRVEERISGTQEAMAAWHRGQQIAEVVE